MTAVPPRFISAYGSAFRGYLGGGSEASLHAAYELGREAMAGGLSVLNLAVAHQDALLVTLEEATDLGAAERIARAAGDFFLESLAAFEMIQRGFREAQEAAMLERRHAEMLRQLSTFLADASVAVNASESVEEMLRLVAEQARELIDAEWCAVTLTSAGERGPARAVSASTGAGWAAEHEGAEPRTYRPALSLAPDFGQTKCSPGADVDSPEEGPGGGRLSAALTALDGREVGSLKLRTTKRGSFSEVDEAVVRHLAQMISAAVERLGPYRHRC